LLIVVCGALLTSCWLNVGCARLAGSAANLLVSAGLLLLLVLLQHCNDCIFCPSNVLAEGGKCFVLVSTLQARDVVSNLGLDPLGIRFEAASWDNRRAVKDVPLAASFVRFARDQPRGSCRI
jgi:hypothetical protein